MTYIEKEWKEQTRGKGLWLSLCIVALVCTGVLLQSRSFPAEQGFEVFLLSLYEMNVYLLPLVSLFLASFAILQEREQKTLTILLTKKESYYRFLWKKSVAVHGVLLAVFTGWHFVFALPMKWLLPFHLGSFLAYLITVLALLAMFTQMGLFLGSVCHTRMQLVGANIFVWFFFVFFLDLGFLYVLPAVTTDNVWLFSLLYFLDPLHALHFYLETSLGLFPLEHMSRLMQKFVWWPPAAFVGLDLLVWVAVTFGLAGWLRVKGERT